MKIQTRAGCFRLVRVGRLQAKGHAGSDDEGVLKPVDGGDELLEQIFAGLKPVIAKRL